jgi:ATP/maltotriose-dependent transcriptional regulator MalT
LREGYERLRHMGERALLADTAATLARAVYAQDRLDEAGALAREAADGADEDDLAPQFGWRMVRAAVLARRGEPAQAKRLTTEALRLVERTDWLNDRADVLMAHAEALAACGERSASREAQREALALLERKGNTVAAELLLVRRAVTVRAGPTR